MPANEFEKQVQEQLDHFELNPSASVWQKVEEQIREKKRRRVIVFFLLPVLVGLLAIGFYWFNQAAISDELSQQTGAMKKDESTATVQVPGNTESVEKPGSVNDIENKKPDNANDAPATKDKIVKTGITKQTPGVVSNKVTTGKEIGKVQHSQQRRVADQDVAEIKIQEGAKGKKESQDGTILESGAPVIENNIADTKQLPLQDERDMEHTENGLSIAENTEVNEELAVRTEPALIRKQGSPKTKFGVELSGGLAFNNKNTFSFAQAAAFDSYYSPTASAGVGSSPVMVNPPSSVRPGPAFALGLVMETETSRRSSVTIGLQYSYNGNRMKVGRASDTSIYLQSNFSNAVPLRNSGTIYRGQRQNTYTNSYHFVQLPVRYHWQLNYRGRLPVQLNAGVSLGYLFATNALVYDKALGGIYYRDNAAFNKFHFNLGTGLSFRLKGGRGSEWVLGPEISFDMNRLLKGHDKQYLMVAGFNSKWFFPKRK